MNFPKMQNKYCDIWPKVEKKNAEKQMRKLYVQTTLYPPFTFVYHGSVKQKCDPVASPTVIFGPSYIITSLAKLHI